jgi:hypothetical protein
MGRFYTFRKVALRYKAPWQKLRFTTGKGYWLFGTRPVSGVEFTMYDSVNVSQIPAKAEAVAGYVNGHWPTYPTLLKDFPHAKHLSIAVTVHADAECLDVEAGDATPSQAPAWVVRQKKRGVKKPVVYTSVSQAPALLRELDRAGIKRSAVRLWTAHYTFRPHRCDSKCGFGFTGKADATQWTDKALGKNLDGSLCAPDFL